MVDMSLFPVFLSGDRIIKHYVVDGESPPTAVGGL